MTTSSVTAHQKKPRRPEDQNRATFTAKELATHLGVSEVTVYRMLKSGEIPRRRAGKRYLIPRTAVEDWLRSTPAARERRAS